MTVFKMNTENHLVRCFIYCRNGREATDLPSASLSDQEKRLIEYAERNEINIVGIFKETTNTNLNKRPIFFTMLQIMKRKEAIGILILNNKCIPTSINYYSKLLRLFEQNLIVEFISAE